MTKSTTSLLGILLHVLSPLPPLASALPHGSAGHCGLTNKLLHLPASDWVGPRGDPSGRETVSLCFSLGPPLPGHGSDMLHPSSKGHSHYSRTISTATALSPGSRNLSFPWLKRPKGSNSPYQRVPLPLAGLPQPLQTLPSLNSLPSPPVRVPSVSRRLSLVQSLSRVRLFATPWTAAS